MKASLAPVLALTVVGLALAGCSGSAGSSTSAGTAECTDAALAPAVAQQAESLGAGNTITVGSLQCSGDWAVVSGTLEPAASAITLIFRASGSDWAWQEPEAVCGSSADKSEVPADLYPVACPA